MPAQQPASSSASKSRLEPMVVRGRVTEIHSPRLFSIRDAEAERDLVVLAPRALSPAVVGATVRVEGAMRRVGAAELARTAGARLNEPTRDRLMARPVLVATSVLAALQGEVSADDAPAAAEEPAPPASPRRAMHETSPSPLTIRASTLVAHLDGFAGQQVRVVNARVVGLLEPRAFLVEPATEYLKSIGMRDRIVVLIEDGALRVSADLLVGSTVTLEGVARTLLGMRVTGEVPWPDRLTHEEIEHLEVRAAVLARSVRTAEGTELTDRPKPTP
jgi:hypothetical protein